MLKYKHNNNMYNSLYMLLQTGMDLNHMHWFEFHIFLPSS